MRFEALTFLAAIATASAQAVVGTAYGFAVGTTGGGSAAAVTPSTAAELAAYLADDVPRVILINKVFDFTGTKSSGKGCDRKSCSVSGGGQYYLGDLSCGSSDNIAVNSISYDAAGTSALPVGSNKSILGVGAKGVLKGKGLSLKKGASNVIIQGLEFTTINPGIVWGGDALDLQGSNDGVWVDHCKFSLIGRQFIVSHYTASRVTLSNNEFNGVTTTSASCNGNHYWTMMFIANGDRITFDRNYFHDVSGRAPKLGADGVSGTFHAVNNYFENMKGHAFDSYNGASSLIEGNVFKSVSQPSTDAAAKVSSFVVNGGSACSATFGRNCLANSVDSTSGKLNGGTSSSFISSLAKYKVTTMDVGKVAAFVKANAGPANLGAASKAETPTTTPVATTKPAATQAPTTVSTVVKPATTTAAAAATAQKYGQCGGQGYTGAKTCPSGWTCKVSNTYYSQCLQ